MSTTQFNVQVTPEGLTPIVDLVNAPNSPSEVIIQNMNGDGYELYLGSSTMWDQETYGIKLLDGMSISLSLGPTDELYAFANGYFYINILRFDGSRR